MSEKKTNIILLKTENSPPTNYEHVWLFEVGALGTQLWIKNLQDNYVIS